MGLFDMFGIYGERWKSIASRMPRILALEQRSEGRKLYAYVRREKQTLVNIQEDVVQHRVTAALKKINKWKGDVKKAGEKGMQLGMNQVFQYFHILKISKHFTDALDKFVSHANTRPKGDEFRGRVDALTQGFAGKVHKAIMEAEKWGGSDMRTLMAYMNEELNKKPGNFIASVVTALKRDKKLSTLGKIPLRINIKREVGDLTKLAALSKMLESLDKRLESSRSKELYDQILGEFERVLFEGEHDIEEMFRVAHLVMKRDLLLLVMVASDEGVMHELDLKWVQQHFLPEEPIRRTEVDIDKLNKKLSEKAHTLANGLNVIVKGMDNLKEKMEIEMAKAR